MLLSFVYGYNKKGCSNCKIMIFCFCHVEKSCQLFEKKTRRFCNNCKRWERNKKQKQQHVNKAVQRRRNFEVDKIPGSDEKQHVKNVLRCEWVHVSTEYRQCRQKWWPAPSRLSLQKWWNTKRRESAAKSKDNLEADNMTRSGDQHKADNLGRNDNTQHAKIVIEV